MLCRGPNAKATTVQARHITLYGILKSGVGNDTIAPLVLKTAGYPEMRNTFNIDKIVLFILYLDFVNFVLGLSIS